MTARLALSPFGGTPAAELAASAEAAVEASRQAVLGPEGAAAGGLLDTLLLHWLDYEVGVSMVERDVGVCVCEGGRSVEQ